MGIFTLPPPKHSLVARHSKHYPTNLFILLRFCIAVLLASTLAFQAQAQVKPVASLKYFTYTSLEEKTMYIHGGETPIGELSDQFFALDLTKRSWTTDNPPWKAMPKKKVRPPPRKNHTMVVSAAVKRLYFWFPGTSVGIYDLTNGVYGEVGLPQPAFPSSNDSSTINGQERAVFCPANGLMYVLCGTGLKTQMLSYHPGSGNSVRLRMVNVTAGNIEEGSPQVSLGIAVAWSVLKNAIVSYGGYTQNKRTYNPHVQLYTPGPDDQPWEVPNVCNLLRFFSQSNFVSHSMSNFLVCLYASSDLSASTVGEISW